MTLWRQARDVFLDAVKRRLENGHRDYGGKSFAKHPVELIDQVQQECLDIPGWSFILWHRLQQCRKTLADWKCPNCGEPVDLAEVVEESTTEVPMAEAPEI